MKAGLLGPYEHALTAMTPLNLLDTHGRVLPLDVARFLAPVNDADLSVVARCRGPVLDVGCGPGRFVSALAERGIPALGVDLAPTAVQLARGRGGSALRRDVFARLPGEGRWPTILLVDGNIGLGGDVLRLLGRLGKLLAPGGQLLVETEPHDCDEQLDVRFHQHGRAIGEHFPWARVGPHDASRLAVASGLQVVDFWTTHGRTFVELQLPVRGVA